MDIENDYKALYEQAIARVYTLEGEINQYRQERFEQRIARWSPVVDWPPNKIQMDASSIAMAKMVEFAAEMPAPTQIDSGRLLGRTNKIFRGNDCPPDVLAAKQKLEETLWEDFKFPGAHIGDDMADAIKKFRKEVYDTMNMTDLIKLPSKIKEQPAPTIMEQTRKMFR